MQSGGTHQPKDTSSPDGSSMKPIEWHCMQALAARAKIAETLFTLTNMKSKNTPSGHDPGDEDPQAWSNNEVL